MEMIDSRGTVYSWILERAMSVLLAASLVM